VGAELAERVATELETGRSLRHGHRDYCGMGLELQAGVYVYAEVNDRERREFTTRAEFVAWLAAQSDESLSGRDQPPGFPGNQRLTIARLQDFVDVPAGTRGS
jgi:hypothetical protein